MSCILAVQCRLFKYVAFLLSIPMLSGCIPVNVSKKMAVPEMGTETVAKDWNPVVGPDLHVEKAYQAIAMLRKHTHDMVFIEPDHFWHIALPQQSSTKTYHLQNVLTAEALQRLRAENIHFLVLFKSNFSRKDKKTNFHDSPFYRKHSWEDRREIVVISLLGDVPDSVMQTATAEGEEKWYWFPGYFLLFVPLGTSIETEHSTEEGVATQLNNHVLAKTPVRPVQIAVIASE